MAEAGLGKIMQRAGLLNVFEVFRCPDPYAAKCRAKASCLAAVSPTSGR
jgi:hypothetical protein